MLSMGSVAGDPERVATVVEELVEVSHWLSRRPFSCSIKNEATRATSSTAQLHNGIGIAATVPGVDERGGSHHDLLSMSRGQATHGGARRGRHRNVGE